MTKEEKRHALFDMLDHPNNYTDEQMQTMLSDDDTRHDYEILARVKSVLKGEQASQCPIDTDAAWQDFTRRHRQSNWHRIAAVVTGVVIVSAFAVAAVLRHVSPQQPTAQVMTTDSVRPLVKKPADTSKVVKADTLDLQPVTFEDVTVEKILTTMASFYGVKVAVGDETMLGVRLYFVWDKRKTLQENISLLNGFDRISLTVEGDSIK